MEAGQYAVSGHNGLFLMLVGIFWILRGFDISARVFGRDVYRDLPRPTGRGLSLAVGGIWLKHRHCTGYAFRENSDVFFPLAGAF